MVTIRCGSCAGPWARVDAVRAPEDLSGGSASVIEHVFAAQITVPETVRTLALDRHAPESLQDATHFKTHAHVFNGLWVIKTLRRYEKPPYSLLDPLYDAVASAAKEAGSGFGRRRGAGRFELAYLAFVFSRHPDVRPWWQQAGHSIWRAAGFKERPSYSLCQLRFAELEHPDVSAGMEQVAGRFIELAVKGSKGRVGRFLHVDSTEAETHARLEHVCPPASSCHSRVTDWRASSRISAAATTPIVRAERHLAAESPEPDLAALRPDTEIGDAERIERKDGRLLVKVGGCWYAVLDATAGVRAYIRGTKVKRFWVGFYNAKAIDHFTGAPVAVRITSASTQEFMTYPALFAAAVQNTGQLPRAVVADRGYSVSPVFEHNTRLGVGSVMPWRAAGNRQEREMEDCDTHDRHGIVRCKHCGAPTRHISFTRTAGGKRGPRLYVQCLTPTTPDCERRQSIGCNVSWRMLLPLWRDSPVYLALRHSHDRYERVHHHWRVRWRSGADDHALRPKRRGLDNQQLRANAALLIEWLMICWREQWMPDSRPLGTPDPDRILVDDGTTYATSLHAFRSELGLDQPYGTNAVALGVGHQQPIGLSTTAAGEDPTEPEEAPVVPPLLPGELEDPLENQPGRDAAEVLLDDELPF